MSWSLNRPEFIVLIQGETERRTFQVQQMLFRGESQDEYTPAPDNLFFTYKEQEFITIDPR